MQWETCYPQHDVLDNTVRTLILSSIKGPRVRTGNVHIQTFTLDSWLHWFLKRMLLSNCKSRALEYLKENMVHSLSCGVGSLKVCGWFYVGGEMVGECTVCCSSCRETFWPGKWALGSAVVVLWKGKEGGRQGERCRRAAPLPDVQHLAACRGRLPPLCLVPARGV